MVRLTANTIRVVEESENDGFNDLNETFEPPAPAEVVHDHVGAWLREARESTGRDLRDVAAHLRIRYPYLLAIEEGRFDDLPGRAYAVGFIRSYSDHLGLDGEAMVGRFKAEADSVTAEQNLKFPTPAPEGRFPGTPVVLVSAVLAAALVGGWYYYQNRDAVDLVRVPAPPVTDSGSETGVRAEAAASPAPLSGAGSGSILPAQAANGPSSAVRVPDRSSAEAASTPSAVAAMPEPAMPQVDVPAAGAAMVDTSETGLAPSDPMTGVTAGTSADTVAVEASERVGEVEQMAAPEPMVAATPEFEPESEPEIAVSTETAIETAPANVEAATDEPAAIEPATVEQAAPAVAPVTEAPDPQTSLPQTTPPETTPEVAALPAVPSVAAPEPRDVPEGRVYGLSNRDARVIVSASGDSWVQVRDNAQNALLTRMLHAGDSYRVPNREGLIMSVGNPSVLSVSIDGGDRFQLSQENVPISDIRLDPARLLDGTAIR